MNNFLTTTQIMQESMLVLKNSLEFARLVDRQYSDAYARAGAKVGSTVNARRPGAPLALDIAIEVEIGAALSYRVASLQADGKAPNYEATIAKLYSSELGQRISRTGLKMTGLYGQLLSGSEWAPQNGSYGSGYIQTVASTIYGGTSEVQRNIIAQRGLGLPRD